MNKIHLNRNRETLGQFTPEEVEDGLRAGRFFLTDLAWRVGMETWKPLGEFPEFLAIQSEVPPPLFQRDSQAELPSLSAHESVRAVDPDEPAWERQSEIGLISGVFQTIKQVLFTPTATFARMKQTGGFSHPLIYLLVVDVFFSIFYFAYGFLGNRLSGASVEVPFVQSWSLLIGLPLLPIIFTITTFVYSAVWHLCLKLLGGATKPYEATFRVICYASSTSVWFLLPVLGTAIAGIWKMVILTLGLKEVHKTSTAKALIAVLLPVIVFLSVILILVVTFMGAIAGGMTFLK